MHCYVSGRVQGVFFRASARRFALQLGLTGYARNLSDGRVEVCACGEPKALDVFRSWLAEGPELAEVTYVECDECEFVSYPGFNID